LWKYMNKLWHLTYMTLRDIIGLEPNLTKELI